MWSRNPTQANSFGYAQGGLEWGTELTDLRSDKETCVSATPKVVCEKPKLPTLWLDTSVIIKLTKVKLGEKLQPVEVARLTRLRTLVQELVAAGKLIFPQSDQEEEYVVGAANRRDSEIHRDFLGLSLGVKMQHRQGIFDWQAQLGMEAYAKSSDTINVGVDAFFYGDPADELEQARKRNIVIGTHPTRLPEILAGRDAAKVQVLEIWEQLRQEFVAKKRPYEEQLEAEKCGYADAMAYKVEEWEKKLATGVPDSWALMDVQGFLMFRAVWKDLGGKPDGLEGLHKYFRSDYHNNLPTPKIGNQLGADLLTGNEVIQSGDVMDVGLLSIAIPACHYVVTDNRQRKRIKDRGIDKDWGTEVYSMSDIDGLFQQLEKLR